MPVSCFPAGRRLEAHVDTDTVQCGQPALGNTSSLTGWIVLVGQATGKGQNLGSSSVIHFSQTTTSIMVSLPGFQLM